MQAEYDFSTAKRATEYAHLNQLRRSHTEKSRITIMLDNAVIDGFKRRAEAHGIGYQTEINRSLRDLLQQGSLEDVLRRVIRDELKHT